MPLQDISNDYLLFDLTQTVTYYVRTGESTFASSASVTNVLVDIEQKEPLLNKWDFQQRNAWFTLWVNTLNSIVPKRGDKIVDASNGTWIVEHVQDQDLIKCKKFCVYCQEDKSV